jgi:hypothetical protein
MIGPAIINLRPTATFSVGDTYDTLNWLDESTPPTREEVDAEVARLQNLWTSTQYQRDRALEYPPMADYLDAVYWQSQGDATKMTAYLAAVEAVKSKYPKGN